MSDAERMVVLRSVCHGVIEAVEAAGPMGAPGGHLYAALMTYGFSLHQFEGLMNGLVKAGKLVKVGHCYRIPGVETEIGKQFDDAFDE